MFNKGTIASTFQLLFLMKTQSRSLLVTTIKIMVQKIFKQIKEQKFQLRPKVPSINEHNCCHCYLLCQKNTIQELITQYSSRQKNKRDSQDTYLKLRRNQILQFRSLKYTTKKLMKTKTKYNFIDYMFFKSLISLV